MNTRPGAVDGITVADGATVITGPGIEYFTMLQAKGRLQLEIATGLKFRQSTLAAVNRKFGTKFRRKDQAVAYLEERIAEFAAAHPPAEAEA